MKPKNETKSRKFEFVNVLTAVDRAAGADVTAALGENEAVPVLQANVRQHVAT